MGGAGGWGLFVLEGVGWNVFHYNLHLFFFGLQKADPVDKSDGKFSRKTISRFRNKLGAPNSKLLSGKKKTCDKNRRTNIFKQILGENCFGFTVEEGLENK